MIRTGAVGLALMIRNAGPSRRTDVVIVGSIAIGIVGSALHRLAKLAGQCPTRSREVRR